jgi:hypothetical protein
MCGEKSQARDGARFGSHCKKAAAVDATATGVSAKHPHPGSSRERLSRVVSHASAAAAASPPRKTHRPFFPRKTSAGGFGLAQGIEFTEEHALFRFRQFLHRFDAFGDGAHGPKFWHAPAVSGTGMKKGRYKFYSGSRGEITFEGNFNPSSAVRTPRGKTFL